MQPRSLRIVIVPGSYAVCRLPAGSPGPAWGAGGLFWTVSGTAEETSVVCEESRVAPGVRAETGFALLKVAGPLDLAQIGIIASIAGPLAGNAISLFPIATFDTDYILVRHADLPRATAALRAAGHTIDHA